MTIFSRFELQKDTCDHFVFDGIVEGFVPFVLAQVAEELKIKSIIPLLFIASDDQKLAKIKKTLNFINPTLHVLHFPAWDCLPYDLVSPGREVIAKRISVLSSLLKLRVDSCCIVILTSVKAVLQKLPPHQLLANQVISAKIGQQINLKRLIQSIENNGFESASVVRDMGEYAVRNNIIDLFPPNRELPIRLNLCGDVIKSIREFNPISQLGTVSYSNFEIGPISEILLTSQTISRFRSCYLQNFGAARQDDALYQALSAGHHFPGMEHWLPMFYDELETLFDYIGRFPVIIFDYLARKALIERYQLICDHYQSRVKQCMHTSPPYLPLSPENLYLSPAHFSVAEKHSKISIDFIPFSVPKTGDKKVVNTAIRVSRNFTNIPDTEDNLFETVVKHITNLHAENKIVFLTGYCKGSLTRLVNLLQEHGLKKIEPVKDMLSVMTSSHHSSIVYSCILALDHGFETNDLCVLTEQDILGKRFIRSIRKTKKQVTYIGEDTLLDIGDIVVHIEHGIGRFVGLKTIAAAGAFHDCLEIHYAGDGRLFLPVENIDLLMRYGSKTSLVTLDKLGGTVWQTRKSRLKKRLLDIAGRLISVESERQMQNIPPVSLPIKIYDEFVARFPYEETEDQHSAIEAVLADLSSGKPMDRLVCGDVGFGKTEVAMRAAFVTAMNNMQVAIVVPTTLLSLQHYKTFEARFQGMPLRIKHISRLVSLRERIQTGIEIEKGTVNIVIGTHALLGSSLNFANLGLLIIDEEHHFGVKHKERLKELKNNVHVLTLSATPIPRTLQLALAGARKLSLITTPPVDRMTVKTFVAPVDSLMIRETLLREHYRGGQSFYVCPYISDLEAVSQRLSKYTPELKIKVAHGQMPARQLNDIMNAFYDGHYDVLLSTSIVESGLDIPTANTLIVHRSDMFGLATLYQLRGRVGRSGQRAYALFTLPEGRIFTQSAEKRLKVLQSLDTLGVGFQIANYDMEIRGAGNILGVEQSGHIKEVGYELYQKMLEEAIGEIREAETKDYQWSPQITIGLSGMIPKSYVSDLQLRLGLYRRLGGLQQQSEIDAFKSELMDRFGPVPQEVYLFLKIISFKLLCRLANIIKLDAGPKGAVIAFHNNKFPNVGGLLQMIASQGKDAMIRSDQSIIFVRNWSNTKKRLEGVSFILDQLVNLTRSK